MPKSAANSLSHYLPKAEPVELTVSGKKRVFDIRDPKLPAWIEDNVIASGAYPYPDKLKRKRFDSEIALLQSEMVKLQYHLQATGGRLLALFEGRDAAGKGGAIFALRQFLNPRSARNVALTKPTDVERGQWYFQRHVAHFPTAGEFVTFDRSWYNRGVVEPVMGFCTAEQHKRFLAEVTDFENMIREDGIHFFKFWLGIGQECQLKRFHDRYHSPLKCWKFSPIDVAGMNKWADYTKYRDIMMERSHTKAAPWTIVRANDKRRARIAVLRRILSSVPYEGADKRIIGSEDGKIIGNDLAMLER
jgi:polyphosphate kinase 2